MILTAAAELFRQHGYHVVGVDELGAAAGVTGPAIYRHFDSKQAVLVELFDDIVRQLLGGARRIRRSAGSPQQHLQALLEFHVDFALEDRTLIAVYLQEERNLPQRDRSRLRRGMRLYVDEWVGALREVRSEFREERARLAALATIGLINSVAHFDGGLDVGMLRPSLTAMAWAALLADEEGRGFEGEGLTRESTHG